MDIDVSKFDPELRSFSTALEWGEPLDLARRRAEYSISELAWDPDMKIRVRKIADPDGDVVVRLYERRDRQTSGALLHIHGGGFVLGDLDVEHRRCVSLARNAECLVVSVNYRLAPEHPYPAGFEDCYRVLAWLHNAALELDVDPARIGVVGSSAGGCLAAAVALRARNEGGPPLAAQLLVYPVLDCRLQTLSVRAFWEGPGFSGAKATEMWRLYAPQLPSRFPEYVSPALAQGLSGLPPAYVSVAEFDPLRDEGIDYATRLLEAGVSAELRSFTGTWHGFDLDAPESAIAREFLLAEATAARRYI